MKKVDKISNVESYLEMREIIRIGNLAVKKAKEENKRYGIPEVISIEGKIYYVVDGELTREKPEILKD